LRKCNIIALKNKAKGNVTTFNLAAPFILSSSSNTKTIPSRSYGSAPLSKQEQMRPSANDWRRQQSVERTFNSDSLLSRVSKMEHAPGMRTPGCPCCDPNDPQNFADSMAML